MPKFNKSIDELKNRFDKWLYVIKNLAELEDIPEKLRERIFKKMFAAAEIAQLTKEELLGHHFKALKQGGSRHHYCACQARNSPDEIHGKTERDRSSCHSAKHGTIRKELL